MSDVFDDGSTVITRRELKALMKRSNKPGLRHLGVWLLLLCATSLIVWIAQIHVVLLVPAMFVHGVVVVHHFALQHECSHYTAFRSRTLCNTLAALCGFLLFIPPRFFRYEHCDHHTYTNQPGHDPEMIPLPKSRAQYWWYLSAIPYWRSQFSGLCRRATGNMTEDEKRFIPEVEEQAIVRESRIMLLGYALILIPTVMFSWTAPVIYWWFPLLLAEPVMRYIRMTEHVGRPTVSDRTLNTRTSKVSRLWRFLAWNMNYHAEHHFAASVPFHALPTLHDKLEGQLYVEQNGYWQAHRSIRKSIQDVE